MKKFSKYLVYLEEGDYNKKVLSMQLLAENGVEAAISPMIHLLNGNDKNLAYFAAIGLGTMGRKTRFNQAKSALIDQMKKMNPELILGLISAAEKLGDPDVIPYLINFLEVDESKYDEVMRVIRNMEREESIAPLADILDDAALSNTYRAKAAEYLGELLGRGFESAIAPLLRNVTDLDRHVLETCFKALKCGRYEKIAPKVVLLMDSENNWIRRGATQVLSNVTEDFLLSESSKDIEKMIISYVNAPLPDIRANICVILGGYHTEAARDALLANHQDIDPKVREITAKSLGRLEDISVIATLVNMLEDEIEDVGRAAAMSLGVLGDISIVSPLLNRLRTSTSFQEEVHTSWVLLEAIESIIKRTRNPIVVEQMVQTHESTIRAFSASLKPVISDDRVGAIGDMIQRLLANPPTEGFVDPKKVQETVNTLKNYLRHEADFVQFVLIPLLLAMGFKGVRGIHGRDERGRDLVFFKENEFGRREYYGIQAKSIDIHGGHKKEGHVTQVLQQAQTALMTKYPFIEGSGGLYLDHLLVMTCGKIQENVNEQIVTVLGDKRRIQIFGRQDLAALLVKHGILVS